MLVPLLFFLLYSLSFIDAQLQDEIHFDLSDPVWTKGREIPLTLQRGMKTTLQLVITNRVPTTDIQIFMKSSSIIGLSLEIDKDPEKTFRSNFCSWISNKFADATNNTSLPYTSSISSPLVHGTNTLKLILYTPAASPHTDNQSITAKLNLQSVSQPSSYRSSLSATPTSVIHSPPHSPIVLAGSRNAPFVNKSYSVNHLFDSSPKRQSEESIPLLPSSLQEENNRIDVSKGNDRRWLQSTLQQQPSHDQISFSDINACHLFEHQYPVNILKYLIESSKFAATLRDKNVFASLLNYRRILFTGSLSTASSGVPVTLISSTPVYLQGSVSNATLLDIVIPPFNRLINILAPPIQLVIKFPGLRTSDNIVLFSAWDTDRLATFFDLIPESSSSISKTLVRQPESYAKTDPSSLVISSPTVPIRFALFLTSLPSVNPSIQNYWESPISIVIEKSSNDKPDESPNDTTSTGDLDDSEKPTIGVTGASYWAVRFAYSAFVIALSFSVIILIIGFVVFGLDPDMLFSLLRSLPGASTSLIFNRFLAWLEGTAMPSSGAPETAEDDSDLENDNKNELQLTLLGKNRPRSNGEERTTTSTDDGTSPHDELSKQPTENTSNYENDNDSKWNLNTTEKSKSSNNALSSRYHVTPEHYCLQPEMDELGGLSVFK